MFRDLKEYQEIQKIYEENVYSTPEEKIVIDALEEQNFTLEELEYIIENIDEVLSDTYITEGTEQEQLDELAKTVIKAAVPLAKRMAQGFSKNVNKIPTKNVAGGIATKTIEKGKNLLKTGADKIKPFMSGAKQKFKSVVDKIKKPIMNNKVATGAVGALGAITVAGAAKKKDAALDAKIKQGIKDSGMGDKGTAITQKGKEQAIKNKTELKNRKEVEFRLKNTESSEQSAKAETAPEKRKLTGKERAQQMAKDRIKSGKTIADVKKANTDAMRERARKKFQDFKAKREAKRLARMKKEEFSSYNIVLEYLFSTEQAATIEEANYVMTEMDAETIQSIVSN